MKPISVFDAHCDTVSRILDNGESLWKNTGMVELCKTSATFERYCQFFALFADCSRPGHATYSELLSCFRKNMRENSDHIVHCCTGSDAELANHKGMTAAFLTVEGAELLDCDVNKLEQAAEDGVVAINLTWNHSNAISGSCREEPSRGLSDLGRRFVKRMEELSIFVDVSHISDPGFWDVMEITDAPVIASHSNSRDVCDHVRNLTNEQITAIIKKHGIIGLNFYQSFVGGTLDFDAVRAHIDQILDLGGARCIAIGGDWDGCDTIDSLPHITALTDLLYYLLRKNYSEGLLNDLFFNNLMRVVKER